MNPRTTALLALAACLLGGFVYFYEIEGGKGREAAVETEKRLFTGVEAEDVDALELETSDGVDARFERRDGGWRIVAPVEGVGDAVALDAIASALAQLPRAGSVKAAPGDLAQFGLGADAPRVRFEAKGASHSLRIGKATPVGGNVYVAADEGAGIAYVESYRVNAWRRRLDDLRDRRIVSLTPGEVDRLAIAWPEPGPDAAPDAADRALFELTLVRDAEKGWQIESPAALPADEETVNRLLSDLAYLQATGFVDERTPAIEAALRETALRVRWSGPGGPEAAGEQQFRIAGLEGDARLVETTGGVLHRIAPDRLDDFARRLSAYRDKSLSAIDAARLDRIELEFADDAARLETPVAGAAGPIVLTQANGSWSAEGLDLDPEALAGLAGRLASLRASDIVADELGTAELASLGLAPPAVRIRLQGGQVEQGGQGDAGAAPQLALELGRLDPERGLFVRRPPGSTVYAIEPIVAEAFALTRADFEARFARAEDAGEGSDGAAADLLDQ